MFDQLPLTTDQFKTWPWAQIEPYFRDLAARELNASTLPQWLADWTRLADLLDESYAVLYIDTTRNTADEQAQQAFKTFLDDIYPQIQIQEQALKEKLLASGLKPDGYAIALRNLRAEADLYREENVPLNAEHNKLGLEFDEIIGAQTALWEGEELPLPKLYPVLEEPDRERRERAWRLIWERRAQDRERLNDLWRRVMALRAEITANADMPDYRAYRWRELKRFDYSPEDAESFHRAVEKHMVPLAVKLYQRRQKLLGLESMRPWDTLVDPFNKPPLRPFTDSAELEAKSERIFDQVDPQLGGYFRTLKQEGLLDLESRKGKGPGAYSYPLMARKRPFIFENAAGTHDDVMTLLHEAGHAFHFFECAGLPYYHLRSWSTIPSEIAEVASMSMELLGAPYLREDCGGFYNEEDHRRARADHLESIVQQMPFLSLLDSFQHWIYTHHAEASDPERCTEKFLEMLRRFSPAVDIGGLEHLARLRWQAVLHIYSIPFYMIEYSFSQLGALQIYRNALQDQAAALKQYRHALSLGGTVDVPGFYRAAGARFGFDEDLVAEMAAFLEAQLHEIGVL